ncbi:hypothetical protein BDZ94DRAFT_1306300 [Collybia nuda]|uniref:Uncharacterized protein n=1 Tax=Collybia nuda TaxID=64659 RepID=A0A9P5YED4_9AGAR|nr:hypothetical protein BDZ94DRAFT_1306300 [Collybia nuda]
MAPPLNIHKLLKDPFGPYYEDIVLDAKFSRGKTLDLISVTFECGGSPIGLDETEFIISAPGNSRIVQHPVYFFGKLQIASLSWLTPKAKKWLEDDLRKRDEDLNLRGGNSGLTLERLYGNMSNEGSHITVLIGCEKSMNALFLGNLGTTPLASYCIQNMTKGSRLNRVLSLDVGAFRESQNFLARYRLWALMNEMIETDPKHTPVEDRTIDWLVRTYLRRFRARRATDLHHRFIFDPNDSDVDSHGNTTTRRHLRRIPHADIRGHFAAHAEWILAQMVAPNSSAQYKLNITKWIEFCKQVKKERHIARSHGVEWGVPYGSNHIVRKGEKGLDLTQFGMDVDFWAKKIKRATAKRKIKAPVKPALPVDIRINDKRSHVPHFIHDPDFLPSSESESDTDSDESPMPSLAARIPSFCLRAPELPAGCFKWKCPGCSYIIDLLDIDEANTQAISENLADHMKKKSWTHLGEEQVQLAFLCMVSNHYKMHLHQNGVNITSKGLQYRVEQWPSKPIPRATRSKTVTVKVEDRS